MGKAWLDFVAAVGDRLEKGREAYEDRSFSRAPGDLVGEIEEELLDVCAWSFILRERLARLTDRLPLSPAEWRVVAAALDAQSERLDPEGRRVAKELLQRAARARAGDAAAGVAASDPGQEDSRA